MTTTEDSSERTDHNNDSAEMTTSSMSSLSSSLMVTLTNIDMATSSASSLSSSLRVTPTNIEMATSSFTTSSTYATTVNHGQSRIVLRLLATSIPVVILLGLVMLLCICFFLKKSNARSSKRRSPSYASDNDVVTGFKAGKEKDNVTGQRKDAPNHYTDPSKQANNENKTKASPAGQYEEVDEKIPKLPESTNKTSKGDSQGYEEVPNNKTPIYHTLEQDSASNGALTSHQNVGYDQLDRGGPTMELIYQLPGPTSKANVEATNNTTGYDKLNPTSQSNSYDLLNRESATLPGGVTQHGVIDATAYSQLNKPISSASASYDKLNQKIILIE